MKQAFITRPSEWPARHALIPNYLQTINCVVNLVKVIAGRDTIG